MANRKKKFATPWHKKLLAALLGNLKITLAGLILLVLALVGLVGKGCGSGASSSDSKQASSAKAVTAKLIIKTPTDVVPEPAPVNPPPPPPSAQIEEAKQEKSSKPKKAIRPKDVADWILDDYESAARDGDQKLAVALGYLDAHFDDKENAADFLAKLLELSGVDTVSQNAAQSGQASYGSGNPSSGKRNPKLIEALIAALAVYDTPRARQILESVIDGNLKMAGGQVEAVAALKALAAHPGPETEEVLFRVVTAQERTAANNPAASDSAKLRSTAIGLIRTSASESLSIRLAKWMLATETSKALHDQVWACLKEPRAENLAAQIILYQSDHPDKAMHDWLEQRIVAYSSGAMNRLLGIPATQANPTRSTPASGGATGGIMGIPALQWREAGLAKAVPDADPYRLAERLWSSELAAVIESRLRALETLDKGVPLIALAGTVPNPSVRAALQRTLERHWDEGPKELKMLRTTEDVIVEPGFVAMVKMLRRNDIIVPAESNDTQGRNGTSHTPAKSTTNPKKAQQQSEQVGQGSAKKTTDKELKEKVEQQQIQVGQRWMEFSQDIVKAACRRFYAVARAKEGSQSGADLTADDIDLPFELHSRAEVAAIYHLNRFS